MPKIGSLGALSSRGFGEFLQQASGAYIEDVFSTYLYAGSGGSQTITNGIDLLGKGGLVWVKDRPFAIDNALFDTARGTSNGPLISNATSAGGSYTPTLSTFNSTGFSVTYPTSGTFTAATNRSPDTYVSWSFRKQPKFFDVITYTGTGSNTTISHNLGSVPGMIIVKRTDQTSQWAVYHNALANTEYLTLNTTAAKATGADYWNSTTPTSTVFSVGTNTYVNANGGTYVAYLYASNAGGFGADGSQNAISCGSFSAGTTVDVNLGYEPQWVIVKCASDTSNWWISDTMRGMSNTDWVFLQANVADAEANTGAGTVIPTATGFTFKGANLGFTAGQTMIYMAIRRGPMRTPTSGTSVFNPQIYTGDYNTTTPITGMNPATDMWWNGTRSISSTFYDMDRLRGWRYLETGNTAAEVSSPTWSQTTQTSLTPSAAWWGSSQSQVSYFFNRAPGFFDVVCYTGTGVATTQAHNLGVAPELMIFKSRNTAGTNWAVCVPLTPTTYNYLTLQSTNSANNRTYGPGGSPNFEELSAPPTSSVINLASSAELNASGRTFVAYLFATCPGVSKVGSYTGTGATQTISCGFTGGARYVLIKRTDSTGDWYVWDSARGMVAGTDPYKLVNTMNTETNTNSVYTTTGGFQIVSTAADINASGGSYIYLAIA